MKHNIALCCIVKNENDYLDEYVNYYHNLGFDKIFIYDNNDPNGENPSDIIGKYNFIEIINCRGIKYAQCRVYEHCANICKDQYDWLAFFDADEFLEFRNNNIKIYEYLESFPKDADTIFINWCNYGDNDLLGNENNNDRHLVNRFIKPIEDNNENIEIKSIVNLHKYLPKFRIPHNPINAINCYDADGNRCENKPILKKAYANVKLNHYRKTIIEYIEHKYNRGFADGNSTPCDFNLFFRYSTRTPEKEEIINNFLQKQKRIIFIYET